jgi:hypothetical protein
LTVSHQACWGRHRRLHAGILRRGPTG